jgi:uncharacterized damage-inducible protein DinB
MKKISHLQQFSTPKFLLNPGANFPILCAALTAVKWESVSTSEKAEMKENKLAMPEPWLRGTLVDVPAVTRAVLHALELAREDLWKWSFPLSDEQLNERPLGIAPVAFHLRHIARSLDRLLTYAEGTALNESQLASMRSELDPGATHARLFEELETALNRSAQRVRALASVAFDIPRSVGKEQLPTTLGGLLVHIADHTQRHVGQAITTAKIVSAEVFLPRGTTQL